MAELMQDRKEVIPFNGLQEIVYAPEPERLLGKGEFAVTAEDHKTGFG